MLERDGVNLAQAAGFVRRWLLEFWECHRSDDVRSSDKRDNIYQNGNSCHEWGGCHRRCWWRGQNGRVALGKFTELPEESGPAALGSELAFLRARVAADAREDSEPPEVQLFPATSYRSPARKQGGVVGTRAIASLA